jgi:hypothetical protein
MLVVSDLAGDFERLLRNKLLELGLHYAGLMDSLGAFVRLYEFHQNRITPVPRRVHLSSEIRESAQWNELVTCSLPAVPS